VRDGRSVLVGSKIFIGTLGWGCGAEEIVAIRAETEEEAMKKLKIAFPGYRPYKSVESLDFDTEEYGNPDIAYVAEFG